ncbi:MAG: branched-chain amino acid transaminase [Myxococcota bacterium]|nr:branched-chain amino acid transaminase [Myxococcota bacterium]MDW8362512.1 branched-chain amino acid transaminase [Myxococcales bacterium]
MVEPVEKVWMDGRLVPWAEATVHVLTHTLHYGLGAFEGIRCYRLEDGRSAIFRLHDHIDRLLASCHIVTIPVPYDRETLLSACLETVRVNRLDECYVRPIVFLGDGPMGLGASPPTRVAVVVWRWGAYLGARAVEDGIRAKVSSFQRPGVNQLMAKGKVVGHYVNSILAKREALRAGYQEAILLDGHGLVSEGSGENIFVVHRGRLLTPPPGSAILGGITRDTVMTLARRMGIEVEERAIARDELYAADEVFLCGTAAEITPVVEIDDRRIGAGMRGPLTHRIQQRYFDVVRGRDVPEPGWLAVV